LRLETSWLEGINVVADATLHSPPPPIEFGLTNAVEALRLNK